MTPLQFLRQARQLHLQFLAGALPESPIYVLGNPSADLDSIISAIIYSYCANNRLPKKTPRPHIPLLNLPNVTAGPELFRLRPEFVTALWLSTNFPALKPEERFEDSYESAGNILREHIITVADFAQGIRDKNAQTQLRTQHINADVTLVDWNALPENVHGLEGSGSLGSALEGVTFRAVGCIDHHVNDNFMPSADKIPDGQPLIIQSGPGSCASLIANEMHSRGIWASAASSDAASSPLEVAQASKLALAPILIDTSNLMAKDKVTDVDLQAVESLRQLIAVGQDGGAEKRNEQEFYSRIFEAKVNSLDRLTLQEVLGRDYKEWTETGQEGQTLTIGFCSAVKPIRWIVQKAGGPRGFTDGVREFASSEGRKLDAVVVMTAFTSHDGQFSREFFISAITHRGPIVEGINMFVDNAAAQLQLVDWSAIDGESVDIPEEEIKSTLDGDEGIWRRLWIQKDVKGSRKQVAPLLRTALRQV